MAVDAETVHVLEAGEGPVLLLLHGNPTWSLLYRGVIQRLSGRFRCLAPDLVGFGLSTAGAEAGDDFGFRPVDHAAVLEGLVEALDLTDIVLVVHDWGGPVGLAAAARRPHRYRGLVVTNSWAWPRRDLRSRALSATAAGPVGRGLIEHTGLVAGLLVGALHTRRLGDAERAHYAGPFPDPASRRPIRALAQRLGRPDPLVAESRRGLEALAHLPALIVWGGSDPVLRGADRRRWERALTRPRTVSVPAGHFVPGDAPAELADALLEWSSVEGLRDP